MNITSVTPERARRIAVRAQALDGSASDILSIVRRLGFLQMDPIAVVARPEHLVLYSRLGCIDAAELERLLWQERSLFEWDAHIWPIEDLPLVRARVRRWRANPPRRWREFLEANRGLRQRVLRELRDHGPALSRDLTAVSVARSGSAHVHSWWGRGQMRLMLDLLQARGDIAVAGRRGGERLWDLADRVYPDSETIRWREASALIEERRRRALGVWLDRGELRAFADAPDEPIPPRLTFLSPFDQLIHDRRRAQHIFDFEYRLEMYVPKAKRKYGYYVLPILRGDRIIGRAELMRDRQANRLRLDRVWWEPGTRPVSLERAVRLLDAAVCGLKKASPPEPDQ
jgi:uncharacterized protein YcaQ